MDKLRAISARQLMDEPEDREIFDLGRYWNAILEYKWGIVFLVLVAGAAGYLVLKQMQPLYQATATLQIENSQSKVINIQDVYSLNSNNQEYLQTQAEILKSRSLAEKVVKRLNLVAVPEFDPANAVIFNWKAWVPLAQIESVWPFDPQLLDFLRVDQTPLSDKDKLDAAVAIFMANLDVEPVRDTQVVTVSYMARNPDLAAVIANTTAQQFIDDQQATRNALTEQASQWLGQGLDQLRSKLQESEQRLQAFREKEKLVDVQGVKTLNAEELTRLTERQVESRRAREEAENLYNQVNQYGPNPPPEYLLQLPAIQANPSVRTLKEQQGAAQQKVDDLSKRYGPKHPLMISAMSELNSVRSELDSQLRRVAYSIESAYQIAVENEKASERQLDQAKQRLQGINRVEFQLGALQRDVDANQKLYDLFMSRTKETQEATGMQSSNVRIIDAAIAPTIPSKPNKKLLFLLILAAGFGLGVLRALIRDAVDNTLRSSDDVEKKLRLSTLAVVPLIKHKRGKGVYEGFMSSTQSFFAECIRSLRTNLLLARVDQPCKVILVTSSVPGEGKTTVALNLTEALGQSQEVLLIDGDLRRSMLSHSLGLAPETLGLSDQIADTVALEDSLHLLSHTKACVLVAGTPSNNPQELLASGKFQALLTELKGIFSYIIIDSPPLQAVSDALILASYADTAICIVKADDTPVPLVRKSIQRLREVNNRFAGVVLNQLNVSKRKNRYEYGYYPPRNHLPKTAVAAAGPSKPKRRVEPTGID